MSDLEISKALALAIGWKRTDLIVDVDTETLYICLNCGDKGLLYCVFDYRDWNVIGPIAERYDAFPYKTFDESWWNGASYADTPQKAIAMAVINGVKK